MNQRNALSYRGPRPGAAVLAVLLLAACSSTPDWANPIEWYRGAAGVFSDDDPETVRARDQAKAKEKKAGGGQFPNLATVPDRPKDISSTEQAGRVQQGLAADRSQARYTGVNPSAAARPGAPPPPVIASPPPPPGVSPNMSASPPPQLAASPPAPQPAAPSPAPGVSPGISAPPPPLAAPPRAPQLAAPPPAPPPLAAPVAAPTMPADTDQVRAAFEAALAQSGGMVTPPPPPGIRDANDSPVLAAGGAGAMAAAPGGIRDANASPVLSRPAPRRGFQPSPGAGAVALRAPAGLASRQGSGLGAAAPGEPVATILFANNSSHLSRRDDNILRSIANMKRDRGGVLRIVGHASSRTRDLDLVSHRLANFRLSLERANAVAAALIRMGVPARDVLIEARADGDPAYLEVMPSGEAGNRRAEIYLD